MSDCDRPLRCVLLSTLLGVMALLGGCSAKPVVPATEFPEPVLVRVPASMGLYMDPRFRTYEHLDKPPKGFEQKVSVGPASQVLFTEFLAAQFRSLTVLSQAPDEQPPPAGVEAILQPVIEDVQIASPRSDQDEFHEAWIKYRLNLRDPRGRLLAAWEIAAYGKHRGAMIGGTHSGLTAAVRDALRDAAAGMALIFRDGAAFRQRLKTARAEAAATVADGDPDVGATP